jgi:dihydroorotate dehydrogenase (NAD+) catalytic subunit
MSKHDLTINPPLMNAAGSLGFSPDLYNAVDWSKLGAFVTNPVSLAPRTPAHGRRFIEFPGGFLLHTGYPNPGITQVLRHYARHWCRSPIPVIVHLLAENPEEVAKMTHWLEQVEGVSGLEVGVDRDASFDMVTALTQGAYGEYPVIIRLPMERAIELAPAAIKAEADAVSIAPPRGIYPSRDGELVKGRLYGPAILPLALRTVHELNKLSIHPIGAGGVYAQAYVNALIAAGALAVQLDSALWRAGEYHLIK